MVITVVILIITAVVFAIGRFRPDVVALCALLSLMLFGVLTPSEALSGFSNPVVIMMIGLFVVSGAVVRTGLAKSMSNYIVRLAGKSELMIFVLVVVVSAVIGGFLNNTGTVALMMPIVVSMAASAKVSPRKLLMPVAFASSMGGMLTLIGSPPNLVIQDTLAKAGYKTLSFFSFTPVGLVGLVVGIIVMLPLSRMFLSGKGEKRKGERRRGKSLNQLVDDYGLADNLSICSVKASSPAIGKTLTELDVQNKYGLAVLEIRRGKRRRKELFRDTTQEAVEPNTVIMAGDTLFLSGNKDDVTRMAGDLSLSSSRLSQGGKAKGDSQFSFYDVGMAEIVLMPKSNFINRTLKDTDFRDRYGVNVVGIRRRDDKVTDNLADVHLLAGDVLLVQGTWQAIASLDDDDEQWVVLGRPLEEAAKVPLNYKAPIAAVIMLLMIVMMVFDFIPVAPVTAVMVCAVLMVLTGCFRNVEAAYKTINWESVVLIAAMLPMSLALEKTGVSAMVSRSLVSSLGSMGPVALLAGIYVATSVTTLFVSNTATAVLMSPIAMSAAISFGVSPYPFLFAVAVGASMCFSTPFSTPPNALVMRAGQYRFMDYVKVGLPLQVIICVVMIFVLPLLFPFK